jgi:predicted GNAT superfamily acetyltransferase
VSTGVPTELAVQVRTLSRMTELNDAMEALRTIWGFPGGEAPISAELMRAIALAGGYVAGAYVDGRLVGASAGFLGQHDDRAHLHSHISGVLPGWQGRHVGVALKQHQREWAIEHGIEVIEWTFDPLIRRNAFFNLVKLGAAVVGFEPNLYGEMNDAINAGDPTDRAIVHWDVSSPSAADPGDGPVILTGDDSGHPVVSPADAPVLRAWIPDDIVELRHRDRDLGLAWRLALRETFGAAVADGYTARNITRDGWYTLVRTAHG